MRNNGKTPRKLDLTPKFLGGTQVDIWKFYEKNKKKGFIHKFMISVAHMVGIYTPKDYVKLGEKLKRSRGIKRIIYQIKYEKLGTKLRIEIPNPSNIGEHFTLTHASSVVIHEDALVGDHCTVFKGVSIGGVRSGKRCGVPIIEDNVCICANSVVVGGVTVGHDSLIASNSFVDFDVPPHSLVIGNPARVIYKKYASKDYVI